MRERENYFTPVVVVAVMLVVGATVIIFFLYRETEDNCGRMLVVEIVELVMVKERERNSPPPTFLFLNSELWKLEIYFLPNLTSTIKCCIERM